MAIRWQIKFKPIRSNTLYTVNIYDALHSGGIMQLKGGAQPFVTQENGDDDMFIPIRTHTGYLRIVDDGKATNASNQEVTWNWKELLPSTDTDRPVTLTDGSGTVLWHGFMQSQNFGGILYGNPQEREFPIQCPLSVLEGTDIDYQQKEIKNFAYLLKRITGYISEKSSGAVAFENVIVQGSADAQTWLLKRIDWQNFAEEDGEGNLSARFNLYQILEDLCRFWGWTARTYRKNLYLVCPDDSGEQSFLTLSTSSGGALDTMAGGEASGTTGGSFNTIEMSGDIFASTQQNDFRQQGPNRAKVTSDCNPARDVYLEFAPDSFVSKMIDGGWQSRIADDGSYVQYTVDKTQMRIPLMSGDAVSGNASFNVAKIQESLGDEGTEVPVIRIKKTYNSSAFASLETLYHHSFKGVIVLRGNIYRKAHKMESKDDSSKLITYGDKTMVMRLGIGKDREHAAWWTGRTWSNSVATFDVAIGGSDGYLWSKATNGTLHTYTRTIGAAGRVGKIFVDFLGSSDLSEIDGQRSFEVAEFSLSIVQKGPGRTFGNDASWVSEREYKSSNANNVRMEWYSDCIYATDKNMANGYGVILNADGTHFTGFDYGNTGTLVAPEQHVADRVTSYWATAKRKLEIELRADVVTEPSPQNKVGIDNTTCYPISISRDWRDDIIKLTLLGL